MLFAILSSYCKYDDDVGDLGDDVGDEGRYVLRIRLQSRDDVGDDMCRWRATMTCGRLHMDLFTCWHMCLESRRIILVCAAFTNVHTYIH